MDSGEFDELLSQLKRAGSLFATLYRDATGEDLDVEAMVRHYPIVALGIAAGAGVVGGWFLGRKARPQAAAPPRSRLDVAVESIVEFQARRRRQVQTGEAETKSGRSSFRELLPEGVEAIRKTFPELTSEETSALARSIVESVLEPRISQRLSSGKVGSYLRKLAQASESKDVPLDEEPPESRLP